MNFYNINKFTEDNNQSMITLIVKLTIVASRGVAEIQSETVT